MLFALVHAAEWTRITASPPRGALVSLQSVRKMDRILSVDPDPPGTAVPPILTAVRHHSETIILIASQTSIIATFERHARRVTI
jgi:hypothetical protein